jgi:hypothetical protein
LLNRTMSFSYHFYGLTFPRTVIIMSLGGNARIRYCGKLIKLTCIVNLWDRLMGVGATYAGLSIGSWVFSSGIVRSKLQ